MSFGPGASVTIFTGDMIVLDRGNGETVNILPPGIGKSVKQVKREIVFDRMIELIRVIFHNDLYATLEVPTHEPSQISKDDMVAFHAACIMVHDIE